MPNRILKDSICTSDNLNTLSQGAEIFFYRLLVQCDDYGRFDARQPILRARCFPLRYVKDADLEAWMNELVIADLVILYSVDRKPYLQVKNWDKHQQIRAKRSKYPAAISVDINGNQVPSVAPVIQSNPIQSNLEEEEEGAPAVPAKPEIVPDPPADKDFAEVAAVYENNLTLLTGILADDLKDTLKEFPKDWVIEAIKETVRNSSRRFTYTRKVLEGWKINGYKVDNRPKHDVNGKSPSKPKAVPVAYNPNPGNLSPDQLAALQAELREKNGLQNPNQRSG